MQSSFCQFLRDISEYAEYNYEISIQAITYNEWCSLPTGSYAALLFYRARSWWNVVTYDTPVTNPKEIRKLRSLGGWGSDENWCFDDISWFGIVKRFSPGVLGISLPSMFWKSLSDILVLLNPENVRFPLNRNVIKYDDKAPPAIYAGDRKLLESMMLPKGYDENTANRHLGGFGVAESYLVEARTEYIYSLLSNAWVLFSGVEVLDVDKGPGTGTGVESTESPAAT